MTTPRPRRGFPLAAVLLLAVAATAAPAQWWTCPAGQGDFELQTASKDRVRCYRAGGLDQVPSICPNRHTSQGVADRCHVAGGPPGGGSAVCPAAQPPYALAAQPGADVCRRTLSEVVTAPSRQVP